MASEPATVAAGPLKSRGSMRLLNLPNLISLGRLLSVPLIIWLIMEERMLAAFWLFVAAGVSDAVDGFIAKRFGAVTELGAYLDPLADKALLVSVYVILGLIDLLPGWLIILVVFRDLLIVGGALLIHTLRQTLRMQPLRVSKTNTAAQIGLAGLVLGASGFGFSPMWVDDALIGVVAVTTFLSGAAYLVVWGRSAADMGGRP